MTLDDQLEAQFHAMRCAALQKAEADRIQHEYEMASAFMANAARLIVEHHARMIASLLWMP